MGPLLITLKRRGALYNFTALSGIHVGHPNTTCNKVTLTLTEALINCNSKHPRRTVLSKHADTCTGSYHLRGYLCLRPSIYSQGRIWQSPYISCMQLVTQQALSKSGITRTLSNTMRAH